MGGDGGGRDIKRRYPENFREESRIPLRNRGLGQIIVVRRDRRKLRRESLRSGVVMVGAVRHGNVRRRNGRAQHSVGRCHGLAIRGGLRRVGIGAAGQRARSRERGRIGSVLCLGLGHHHHTQVDRQGNEA